MKINYATNTKGNYDLVVTTFVALLLISNVAATKLIDLGGLIFDGGAVLFPLTYVIGDILAEVYGWKKANRAIYTGFGLAALMSLCFLLVAAAPPAADWPNQEAWVSILGFVPNIVVASLLGYLVGQLLNALVVVKIKQYTAEKKLWFRLVSSTIVGELADTLVFCTVAFGPLAVFLGAESLPLSAFLNYALVGWIYKVAIEVFCLPITYRVIAAIKKREPDYHQA